MSIRRRTASSTMVEVIAVLNVLNTINSALAADVVPCDNGNGQLVYERIPGYQLQGYDQEQSTTSVVPIQLLDQCQNACLKDLTVKNNLLRPCGSIDFHAGERYGSDQYEASTCHLTEERAAPDGIGHLVRVPGYVHFNKICMPSKSISGNCPDAKYVFERHPEKSFLPPGSNCTTQPVGDRLECERLCLSSTSPVCRSATYNSLNGTCSTCPVTWRSSPAMFKDSDGEEYLENTCLKKERRCQSVDHLVFVEEAGQSLRTANKLARFHHLSVDQCKSKCAENDQVYCRSLEYSTGGNSSRGGGDGECVLSEEDSLSVTSSHRATGTHAHTTLMELMCLDQVEEYVDRRAVTTRPATMRRISDSLDRSSNRRNSAQQSIFFNREGLHREAGREYVTAFRRFSGQRIAGARLLSQVGRLSSQMCMLACLQSRGCRSMAYSRRFGDCELYMQHSGEQGARLLLDQDYDYYQNLIADSGGGVAGDQAFSGATSLFNANRNSVHGGGSFGAASTGFGAGQRHFGAIGSHTNRRFASGGGAGGFSAGGFDGRHFGSVGGRGQFGGPTSAAVFGSSGGRFVGAGFSGGAAAVLGGGGGGKGQFGGGGAAAASTSAGGFSAGASTHATAGCYEDRFALQETGRKLRDELVTKIVSVSSLNQCEDECLRSTTFLCKSFSYRYSSSGATASLDNCELSAHSAMEARSAEQAYEMNRDYDFYERVKARRCSSTIGATVNNDRGGGGGGVGGVPTSVGHSAGGVGGGFNGRFPGGSAGTAAGFGTGLGGVGGVGGGVGGGGLGLSQTAGFSEGGFISTDGGDVTASCDENGMELTLAANAPFYGRMYTFRHYDQCSVVGRGERVISLRITAANGFPACGTQKFGDVMQNIVVVQFSEFVQTNFDKRYNLTCYFQGPGEAVVTSGYISASPGQLTPIIDLPAREVLDSRVRLSILYDGRPTTTIAVGDPLLFRLETQSGANLVSDIFASNVIARDPYSGRSVQLVDRYGCPTDPRLFPGLNLAREGNGLTARFNAFKIPQSNYLLFEATVRPCRERCRPARCAIDGREEPSFGRRRRRRALASTNTTNQDHTLSLPDPADLRVEPQDEEAGPRLVDGSDEEHVKRLLNVYYTRDEIEPHDGVAMSSGGSTGTAPVCVSAVEYHALVAALIVLSAAVVLAAVLVAVWVQRARAAGRLKNAAADRQCEAAHSPQYWSGLKFLQRRYPLPLQRDSQLSNVASLPSVSKARPRKFEDPSEPIYTDPALFESSPGGRTLSSDAK